jgi:hypothetical protein
VFWACMRGTVFFFSRVIRTVDPHFIRRISAIVMRSQGATSSCGTFRA